MPKVKLVYQQIKDYIKQEAKKKAPGEPLPSEVQYSRLFNVSRPTIRKAVDELSREHIVKRIPGKGLSVAFPDQLQQMDPLLFILPYIPDDGFFYNMVMGCVNAANHLGYNYKIINTAPGAGRLKEIRNTDLSCCSAAVIAAYDSTDDHGLIDLLMKKPIPLVLVDNLLKEYDLPYVITDDLKGGYLMGRHLLENDHRKIIYITLTGETHTVIKREEGFRKAFQDAGKNLNECRFIRIHYDAQTPEALDKLNRDYTAVCGYSDLPVIMAFNHLLEQGMRVPEEISFMGYGNFMYSEMLSVPLTTVNIPSYDMGYKAAELAVKLLTGVKTEEKQVLDVGIIHRSSVAPALEKRQA